MVWLHVAAAAVWMGASACVMIAAGALRPGSAEFETFAVRALPAIGRLNLAAAAALFAAGAVRFAQLGASLDYRFPAAFLWLVGAKIVLFGAMAAIAIWSYKAQVKLRGVDGGREAEAAALASAVRRAGPLAGLTTVMGGLAVALGVWLAGLA